MKKYVVIDIYVFNRDGEILANTESSGSEFECKNTRPIIVYNEKSVHPYQQTKNYLVGKGLNVLSLELLPLLLLNKFDTEPGEDYIVVGFKAIVDYDEPFEWEPDDMNMSVKWMDFEDFINDENLLPELQDKRFVDAINGNPVLYSGYYKESDGSLKVLDKEYLVS